MAIALNIAVFSDITDYQSLVEKAKLWLDRGDEIDALFPTFVGNIEGYLNRTLRTPEMEKFSSVSALNGGFSLPADCLQVRGLYIAGVPLDATSPAMLGARYTAFDGAWTKGCPNAYAITGRQVQVAPVGERAIGLSYWQRIPSLSVSSPSNWLLDAYPDIYLKGLLYEANTYIVDTEAAARWSTLFGTAVDQLQQNGLRSRYGGPLVARSGVAQVRGVRA